MQIQTTKHNHLTPNKMPTIKIYSHEEKKTSVGKEVSNENGVVAMVIRMDAPQKINYRIPHDPEALLPEV